MRVAELWRYPVKSLQGERLVWPVERRAERDELEPVGPRDRQPGRVRVDPDEDARVEISTSSPSTPITPEPDDDVDLLLPVAGVVVLASLPAGGERDVVEAESARPEGTANLSDRPAGSFAFEVGDVDCGVTTGFLPDR